MVTYVNRDATDNILMEEGATDTLVSLSLIVVPDISFYRHRQAAMSHLLRQRKKGCKSARITVVIG